MTTAAEKEYMHFGETAGCPDCDYDLIHELDHRLALLWRIDQYIANADGKPELQEFWGRLKTQEKDNVDSMKKLLAKEFAGA